MAVLASVQQTPAKGNGGTLQGDVCLYDEPAYNRYVCLSKGSKVHDTARKRCNIKQDVLSLYCSTSSILKFMLRAT